MTSLMECRSLQVSLVLTVNTGVTSHAVSLSLISLYQRDFDSDDDEETRKCWFTRETLLI